MRELNYEKITGKDKKYPEVVPIQFINLKNSDPHFKELFYKQKRSSIKC